MKKTIKTLKQIDGMAKDSAKPAFKPMTLDQVWGDTGGDKYKTMDEAVYSKSLREMSKADLNAHATSVGILPIDNRDMLVTRLANAFRKHVSSYRIPQVKSVKSKPVSEAAMRILREGK